MQQQGHPRGVSPPAVAALELEVTAGPSAGLHLSVHEDFRVGSAETGPAKLGGDRWLSPSHALLHHGPEGWAVEDLRSAEGTKVNGRAVRGATPLRAGDEVELGSSRMTVIADARAAEPSTAAGSAPAPPESNAYARVRRDERRRDLDAKRLLALVIDSLVVTPVVVLIGTSGHGRLVFWLGAVGLVLTYFFLCESITGQTIGKRVAGLRVVRVDGLPLTPSKVAARTVLRIVDQQVGSLVGMLSMILTGQRRQRLGDLAAGTAVTLASAPAPRPAQRGRELLALYVYPCLWVAPAVLMFALLPEARLLPCDEAGITLRSGAEGSCLAPKAGGGGSSVIEIVNTGHSVRLPDYSARLVGTTTRDATRRAVRFAEVPPGVDVAIVAFKLRVRNTSGHELPFQVGHGSVGLVVARHDGRQMVVKQLPPRIRTGLRPFAAGGPIGAGKTRSAWVSFMLPREIVPVLRQAGVALLLTPVSPSNRVPDQAEIRLGRASTPAGARALAGLSD